MLMCQANHARVPDCIAYKRLREPYTIDSQQKTIVAFIYHIKTIKLDYFDIF